MTNGEEFTNGFTPTVADALDDADGDRYPNIFEIRRGSNPNSASSIPTPNYTVNAAGGGTHTTISAAVTASNVANGAYQIIAIAPGTYTGAANLNSVSVSAGKPKLLIVGLEGAGKTIIDGGGTLTGWTLSNTVVVSSLTFRRATLALWVHAGTADVGLADLVVRDNAGGTSAGGVSVLTVGKLRISGSTFLNNTSTSSAQHVYLSTGNVTVTNTVMWGQAAGTYLGKAASGVTLTNGVDPTGLWPDDKCRASIEKQCKLACQNRCSGGKFMAACVPVCIFIESSLASPDNQLCADTDNCEKEAMNAMAMCRATGGSVKRCAMVYDRVLARCLGMPIPPVSSSAN